MITHLGVEDVPIKDLTPYPGNAKRGDVALIRESLRRNGQYRSLVVRRMPGGTAKAKPVLTVLAGNHTMRAMAAERHTTVRCELVECDDDTARRVNLADNRTSDAGGHDQQALADLLTAAAEADAASDGQVLYGTGYTDEDLAKLLGQDEAMPPAGDAAVEAVPGTWALVVDCADEAEQAGLLDRFAAEGLRVRALIT